MMLGDLKLDIIEYKRIIFQGCILHWTSSLLMVQLKLGSWQYSVVVPKCFIKHMCFIVLYFHGHAFFSLEIAKK